MDSQKINRDTRLEAIKNALIDYLAEDNNIGEIEEHPGYGTNCSFYITNTVGASCLIYDDLTSLEKELNTLAQNRVEEVVDDAGMPSIAWNVSVDTLTIDYDAIVEVFDAEDFITWEFEGKEYFIIIEPNTDLLGGR
jgi:hypothetical protein